MFLIYSNSLENYIADIVSKASKLNISIDSISNMRQNDGLEYSVSCYVTSIKQLDRLFADLRQENYITGVERLLR